MTMFLAPYTAIADIDGSPLDAGFIYFGEYGENPESFPIPVYWDADFTIPAAQPIRTRNGYPIRNDSPCKIYLKQAEHSLVIKNKNLSAVLVEMNNKGISSSLLVRPNGDTVETSLVEIDAALGTKASSEYVDNQLSLKADKTYLDASLTAITGGHKAYGTLAGALANTSTFPQNSIIEITNDGANNGAYLWNGGDLTKSAYDPLTQAKVDATTKANAAEANAKAYTDQIDKKIDYYQTENLLNPNQETAVGYYVNGVPGGQAGSVSALEYYPVAAGQKLWVRGATGSALAPIYAADKTFIGNLNYNDAVGGVLTVAESYGSKTPAFVRFSLFNNTSLENFSFGYGDLRPPTALAYTEKYASLRNPEFIRSIDESISPKIAAAENSAKAYADQLQKDTSDYYQTQNILNPTQATAVGYYVNGVPNGAVGHISALDYYKVLPSQKFWTRGAGGTNLIAVYDSNKAYIGSINYSNAVDGVLTIPSDFSNKIPAFIRLSAWAKTTLDGFEFGLGDKRPPNVLAYLEKFGEFRSESYVKSLIAATDTTDSSLKNKKWAAMGDSITTTSYSAGANYATILSNKHGSALTLYSRGGATVHRMPESTAYTLSEEYLNIPTATPPDLITIAGGTNDPVTTGQLGVFSDRVNTTFYGALHVLLAGLRNRFPNARIGFIAPIPRTARYIEGDTSNTPYLKWKAIKEVCAYYSVPCWNGNTEFGASPNDSTTWKDTYMPDTLHPNNAGHVWYANRVEDFILSLAK